MNPVILVVRGVHGIERLVVWSIGLVTGNQVVAEAQSGLEGQLIWSQPDAKPDERGIYLDATLRGSPPQGEVYFLRNRDTPSEAVNVAGVDVRSRIVEIQPLMIDLDRYADIHIGIIHQPRDFPFGTNPQVAEVLGPGSHQTFQGYIHLAESLLNPMGPMYLRGITCSIRWGLILLSSPIEPKVNL